MVRYRIKDGDVFREQRFSEYADAMKNGIESAINKESDNYILNVNEDQYIESLESMHCIELPTVDFDAAHIGSYEAEVSVEFLPRYYGHERGRYINHNIYQLFIPISGNRQVLKLMPSTYSCGMPPFTANLDYVELEYLTFTSDSKAIKGYFDNAIQNFKNMYDYLSKDISRFNDSLKSYIRQKFNLRKSAILSKNNLLAEIGYPLKKRDDISGTFTIPSPKLREKIVITKPVVTEKDYSPTPILDNHNYSMILKHINDAGRNFERMPSVYTKKHEEDLRDHILFLLDPQFENGSASGETFNKVGKTDIQLRYDSSVVFIAECKFWHGEKEYIDAITQLLNYLTWRDTKTSLIIFVRQKNISQIIDKIKQVTVSHPNYVKEVGKTDDNWFNYTFHLNEDTGREIKLAVQVFHIP